jgi:hypothetical protein
MPQALAYVKDARRNSGMPASRRAPGCQPNRAWSPDIQGRATAACQQRVAQPLNVTAAGLQAGRAATPLTAMAGSHRIPDSPAFGSTR